ncbi:hypothetical protein I79_009780 [Cricetulus griseus]|uniref:Uncharacterized protein n=1 Tax=Cricetulus griseus TaxID=10029 RepID=G3HGP2_CRIGR|nr:hypothetical protein I79_009780 [Cricetulus griseus]
MSPAPHHTFEHFNFQIIGPMQYKRTNRVIKLKQQSSKTSLLLALAITAEIITLKVFGFNLQY